MSVDDMLWWLYDTYKIVVGTRTIRRVFERKGDKVKIGKNKSSANESTGTAVGDETQIAQDEDVQDATEHMIAPEEHQVQQQELRSLSSPPNNAPYQSPYAPLPSSSTGPGNLEEQLRQAMQQQTPQLQHPYPVLMDLDSELPDDEETIELQLQQIALQKREVELKLKMRRLKGSPEANKPTGTSTLYNPNAVIPPPSKRDSRSKKKIAESKRRTAERQERMLRDLERRSRRRDHLTAEWVQSKDIWPLRAQGMLADLMHQYGVYTYSSNNDQAFDAMYRELYGLVDHTKGDWDPGVHDEMLRERMKRKMGQLRAKMQKTGEIIAHNDGYPGFMKAEDYTGEQAGAALGGDESDILADPALHSATAEALQQQTQPGAPNMHPHDNHLHYDVGPVEQDIHHPHHSGGVQYPAPIMHPSGTPSQYPMLDQHHGMLPYAQLGAPQQEGLGSQDGLVM